LKGASGGTPTAEPGAAPAGGSCTPAPGRPRGSAFKRSTTTRGRPVSRRRRDGAPRGARSLDSPCRHGGGLPRGRGNASSGVPACRVMARQGAAIRTSASRRFIPSCSRGKEGMQSRVDPVAPRPPEWQRVGFLTS
jgi:hypothetical protein